MIFHTFITIISVTLFLVVLKVLIAIHQFEIAKNLNSENSPICCLGLYTGFINAITLQQTPVQPKYPGTDIEAPGQDIEAPPAAIYRQEEPQPEQSTTIEITTTEEVEAPQSVPIKSVQRPIQAPGENIKTFKPVKVSE